MSLLVDDPAQLSKSRLKSDLVAHNVTLPPAQSRKEVYVELHLKHIDQKNTGGFSSDEEDQDQDLKEEEEEEEEDAEMPDPIGLTDDDLKAALLKRGVKAGPIVASTRALYETKLRKLQSDGRGRLNGVEKGVLYSDSEEEEEDGEEEDKDSGPEGAKEETVEQSDQTQQLSSQEGSSVYPQCFIPSSRLHAGASRNRDASPKWNSGNAIKPLEQSRPRCSQSPVGISRASSVDQRSGLGSGRTSGLKSVVSNGDSSVSSQAFSITQMVEEETRELTQSPNALALKQQMETWRSLSAGSDSERRLNGSNVQDRWSRSNGLDVPVVDSVKNRSLYYTPKASPYERDMKVSQDPVKDTSKDIVPNTDATPTRIYATCRRPIKGAAGRPVQYAYPDTPASPTTLERREVERRLVPVHIQILVFLVVACLLYLSYVCVEDSSFSPVVAFLDGLNQRSDGEDAETQDTPALSLPE